MVVVENAARYSVSSGRDWETGKKTVIQRRTLK